MSARTLLSIFILTACSTLAQAAPREQIAIVGSSTIYPFALEVGKRFSAKSGRPAPEILSTGSGGGIKAFCTGPGEDRPDIVNASRQIKRSELETCAANGVTEVVELKIGYDGIVIANSRQAPKFQLGHRDLFLALAKEVPDPTGSALTIANPYRNWKEINPALPDIPIEIIGPPPGSGTRDTFIELALENGCRRMDLNWIARLQKAGKGELKRVCDTIREDGMFVNGSEDDTLIEKQLEQNPNALGIFGYSYLHQNSEQIQGASLDGIEPSLFSIGNRIYKLGRPLYVYVKRARVEETPGLQQYLAELTSEQAWGEAGYLPAIGLVSMPEDERKGYAAAAVTLPKLTVP